MTILDFLKLLFCSESSDISENKKQLTAKKDISVKEDEEVFVLDTVDEEEEFFC